MIGRKTHLLYSTHFLPRDTALRVRTFLKNRALDPATIIAVFAIGELPSLRCQLQHCLLRAIHRRENACKLFCSSRQILRFLANNILSSSTPFSQSMNSNSTDHDSIPLDYTAVMGRITRSQPTITFAELMLHIFPPGVDRPYILKLPRGVLGRMVSFVDTNDLTALRLTCKKLEKAVMSKFVDHFIKCRRHVLSLYSLLTLAHVVTHPVFG